MTPQQHEKVQKIVNAAWQLPPAERKAFVERACAGDEEVRRECESLLQYDPDFIRPPRQERLKPGYRLSRYEVIEALPAGGMGEVYRARDPKLGGRDVAIKILPSAFTADPERVERLEREAYILASLENPHICTIHDIGHDKGIDYMVMEFIQGETLRTRLERPRNIQDFKSIAEQCLQALDAAHEKQILHLDIKPENIMIDARRCVKLCDFGLAKPINPSETTSTRNEACAFGGTPGYIAPEAFVSGFQDKRSDIFSLGVVFYELLYERHPFQNVNDSTLTPGEQANLMKMPPLELDSRVPRQLNRLLQKMLAASPKDRYNSAAEILEDLDRVFSVRRIWQTAALVLLMVVSAVATPGVPARINLAVLPFAAIGDGLNQTYADGLTQIVTTKLCQLPSSSTFQGAACPADMHEAKVKTAQDARSELGANVLLSGTVKRVGDKIVINYSLSLSFTDRPFLRNVFVAKFADPVAAQNEFLEWLIYDLRLKLAPSQRPVVAPPATSHAAYDFFVRGLGALRDYEVPDKIEEAIGAFDDAIRLDTNFAAAHARLGEAYWRKYLDTRHPETIASGIRECDQAATLDPNLPDARVCLGALYNSRGDYMRAIEQLEIAIKLQPANDLAYRDLGESYERLHDFNGAEQAYLQAVRTRPEYWASYTPLGRFYYRRSRYQEAVRQYLEAIERAPANRTAYYSLGGIYLEMGQYDDAIENFNKANQIRPTFQAFANLGNTYIHMRQFDNAVVPLEQASRLNNRNFIASGTLARAVYFAGKRERSYLEYERAIQLAQEQLQVNPRNGDVLILLSRYFVMLGKRDEALYHLQLALVSPERTTAYLLHAAVVQNLLGGTNLALSYLEEAVAQGFSRSEIRATPEFDNLRGEPRFQRLIESN